MAVVTGVVLPNDGDRIKAINYNDPINKILAQVNGNLDDSNITSVSGTKIGAGTLPYTAFNTAAQTQITDPWIALGTTPTVVANGNRSYTWTTGVDKSTILSPGMRVRTTRTVAAPTQCTNLNGTTQFYSKSSPAGMTFTDDFVASAWVKLSSYATGNIISRYNGTSGWRLAINASGQVVLTGLNAGAANYSEVTSYQSIPLNKWVHITAQLDMSTFTATTTTSYVMIDGVDVPAFVGRGGTNPTALVQAGNLEVGSWNGGLQPLPGKIAQVAIYNVKVTQPTIRTSISQGLLGTETGVASAYSFNNVITDLNVSNANNLTANGSAVATNADSPFGGQASGAISSTLDYGIIQTVNATTLVVQVAEGCTVPTTGGVSAVSYSNTSKPYGFPSQTGKWRINSLLKTSSVTTSNANYGSFISGGWALTTPVGEWNVGWQCGSMFSNSTTEVWFNISPTSLVGLSNTAGHNVSSFGASVLSSAASYYINSIDIRQPQSITSQSTYVMYTSGATTAAGVNGTVSLVEIYAENAYL